MRTLFRFLAAFALLSCLFVARLIVEPGSQLGLCFLLGVLCAMTVEFTLSAARRNR